MKIVDSSFPGILAISVTHKHSSFCMILIGTYLPSIYSKHGGDPDKMFYYMSCFIVNI